MVETPRVAVIGAGLTGLTLARALAARADVTVLEKSRGLGGRMSTRRTEGCAFDHGAQYFSARGEQFKAFLEPYLAVGVIAPWAPRRVILPTGGDGPPDWTEPRYVAVPGMTALAKALAEDLSVERSSQVGALVRDGAGWRLATQEGADLGYFDWVISTAPAIQSAALLPEGFSGTPALTRARMLGCYSLMLGLAQPLDLAWDAAWVSAGPLAWIAVDSSKPGRGATQCIVAQASNNWAEAHLERDQEAVRDELLQAFEQVTGVSAAGADCISLHRWRYASVAAPAGAPFLLDAENRLAAAGDWCGAGKVEAAFDSASALATALGPLLA